MPKLQIFSCLYQLSDKFILGPKFENQACNLDTDNCDYGLTCQEEDDGCENGVGKCRKGCLIRINLCLVVHLLFNFPKNVDFFSKYPY